MKIRIVSPSGAIDARYIDGAAARLMSWGHDVSIGKNAKNRFGRFAGTHEQRLEDLQEAIDEGCEAVLCSRGGFGMFHIIDKLCLPKGKPLPLFIGFSDITCLHRFAAVNNVSSLHAIMCKHIATLDENSEPMQRLRQVLEGKDLSYTIPSEKENILGKAEGTLVGGNLTILSSLQATPFASNNPENSILFIEDVAEAHYRIDGMLQSLRLSGYLPKIKGLIIGQFTPHQNDPSMNGTIWETIREVVKDYGYPVAFNFPAGHVDQNMPLWMNTHCVLEVSEAETKLKFSK